MRLGDIKPLLLPLLDGIIEGTCWPCNLGHLAHHGASAFGMLTAHYLGIHIKNLQPYAEVWRDAEKGLAHDDECRDVEEGIGG